MAKTPSMWVIYDKPKDHEAKFVARRWEVDYPLMPTDDILSANDLESLRALLPSGLVRMDRMPGDDPVIVEAWF
ncbi:hypothetical protein [Marinobacter sp.]|uniref:hypothetical protein n=1 Tax=Marinobacter sp. TaxID=50741 RepID=UPI003A92DF35